ncbi:Uncharacterised protein [Mycobacteroides abscessus]|uniref:hypothetical protein n=1 Tax=Mycobacteroides abscessus TaxID=36809 RepID=UPI000373438E|nr:hypothetical protein [Mycobacteroides abscessus]CPT79232.1 Uncharacterised protein [Mycobacteroides abscessus]CPU63266.1 Uncharacterised protein [Mycobacteroides abscessus]SKK67826.1 Uncharacterised protein [Mycobacteroides abscessus subsp. massiliense]SKQ42571.1 DNA-binding protein, putative [Mycobacteroides abscessus subsp. massiliense]SKW99033.1 DNA-binding protein, putative [Mycobacteroides abscessus subsp. massiliense]
MEHHEQRCQRFQVYLALSSNFCLIFRVLLRKWVERCFSGASVPMLAARESMIYPADVLDWFLVTQRPAPESERLRWRPYRWAAHGATAAVAGSAAR